MAFKLFGLDFIDESKSSTPVINAQTEMDYNSEQAQLSREFNALEAQKNRDFQERMSNTAIERQFSQLKALGINPYAMLSTGGASTPTGSALGGASASYSGYASADRTATASENNTARTIKSNEKIALINATAKVLSSLIYNS